VTAEGEILQIGSPSDVYLHPATPFVARFLGETNLLPGTCRGVEHGHIVVQVRSGELGRARTPRFASRPAAGDAVLASIRPERLRILKADEAADSCLEGKAVSCAFLGRHARYVIDAGHQSVVVTTVWSEADALAADTPVRLGWLAKKHKACSIWAGAPDRLAGCSLRLVDLIADDLPAPRVEDGADHLADLVSGEGDARMLAPFDGEFAARDGLDRRGPTLLKV
jgi:hypothetical protein